jgi:hypothetical protein
MSYYKFEKAFLDTWRNRQFYDERVLESIGKNVELHSECKTNAKSSAAACLNVLGSLSTNPEELKTYLNSFGLGIQEIIKFPSGIELDGELYDDNGYVIFEWIGPGKSVINEKGGSRGKQRTSVDAYVLARVENRITQILIEWKFTESYLKPSDHRRFSGQRGIERLRRYSTVLQDLRRTVEFPLKMSEEGGLSLADLGYEPIYQLLRITLLAIQTTPMELHPSLNVEDYMVLHLSHSKNTDLINLPPQILTELSDDGLSTLHDFWKSSILSPTASGKFHHGYWNEELNTISNQPLKEYLTERYG